jgi:FeS assembly SUF system regulator
MIRLSKLADYGIVLLNYVAQPVGRSSDLTPSRPAGLTARELSQRSGLPYPTVSKVLKALGRGGLLVSQRGIHGGYALARPAEQISVAEMVSCIDGPIALTSCLAPSAQRCELEAACPVRGNWQRINSVVLGALSKLSLADMQRPSALPLHAVGQPHRPTAPRGSLPQLGSFP